MRLARYGALRALQALPLVLAAIVITFLLIHAAPGDPALYLAGVFQADAAYLDQLREEFGLNDPLYRQFWTYLTAVAQLDLGYSLRMRTDVLDLILQRLPATLLLMAFSVTLSGVGGVALGLMAGRKPYSLTDNVATGLALTGYSMPVFWLGQLLLVVFALGLGWFPVQGMTSLRAPSEGFGRILDILHHLALPALTYSAFFLTLIYRLTRQKTQEVLALDFVTTARSKGASERRVILRHVLPNSLLTIVTVIGLNVGLMISGSVLVETVFAWPGLGRLLFDAILARDYPVLMGLFIFTSLVIVIVNLVTDLLYAVIDPRVVYR